jgi:carbon-monoxide dehydrogenase large subunit
VEDPRFLRGEGTYLDNRVFEGAAWMVPVRSAVAHGTVTDIETADAATRPGVIGVFTASDLPGSLPPDFDGQTDHTLMPLVSGSTVRFVGDVVAVVVAETQRQAVDAAGEVWVSIDPLPAVPTVDAALAPEAPILFDGLRSNVVDSGGLAVSHPPPEADIVIQARVRHQRLAPVPMETNNAAAVPTDGGLDVWLGSQRVHGARAVLAHTLGLDPETIRVRVPDMGGGFGAKIPTYREQAIAAALALRLGRPVRWQERRTENLVSMTHGRGQVHTLEMGARADGKLVWVRIDAIQDVGAYPLFATHLPRFTQRMAAGPYDIPHVEFRWRSVVTNTTPVHAYRGAGRPEAAATLERGMDLLARRLDLDPAEVRRRNLHPAGAFPLTTATGERYDSGNYHGALDLALTMADYPRLREEQARRLRDGSAKRLGVGVSTYVEVTAPAGRKDWGAVEVHPDGSATVSSGASSHGQGHETSFAQIASEVLGIPLDAIRFVQADTALVPRGGGTMGSRSLQMAGSAVLRSSRALVEKAKRLIAHISEAAVEDIVVEEGMIGIAGLPDSRRSWAEVAALAHDNLPEGMAPGLRETDTYTQEHSTVPFGAHVSVVEVDVETGEVAVLRHIACDDCGNVVNRMLVDGQVHGGIAQGIGQALFEQVTFDEDANPLTGNLTGYLLPTAPLLPSFEVDRTRTPSPDNPLGVKGVGEAGTIGSTPAVHGAVLDALAGLGVTHVDLPLTPLRVWQAINRPT